MGGIESWGTSAIQALQSFSTPALDTFFKLVTLLGDEKFYLLLLPLVYWCFDKRLGMRLAVLVMASNTVNLWIKFALGLPRPPGALVRHMTEGEGPGFPSGHTQSVTVACGYLVAHVQRWRAHLMAAALVLLVGLSRIYLGVHFPHDVLGGLVIGYVLVFLFVKGTSLGEGAWRSLGRLVRYGLAAGGPLLLFLAWPLEDAAGSLGALAGFGLGALLEGERLGFQTAGSGRQRALRFLVGGGGVAALYFGRKVVLPPAVGWRFVRYATVGLFGTALAPWLFVRLGLARSELAAAYGSE